MSGLLRRSRVAPLRLTPGYRADRDLPGRGPCTPLEVRVSARDVHPAALAAALRPHFLDRLPKAERAVGDRELGRHRESAPLQVEQQVLPGLRTLAHTVDQAD